MAKILVQIMPNGDKLYKYVPSQKCTPEQIAQVVKHLSSVVQTIRDQQGLDVTLTDWTQSEPDDQIHLEPPMLIIKFNEFSCHPEEPGDSSDELPF